MCLLRRDGRVVGASSVYPADVELIGRRRFWIYRSLLDAMVADQAPAMIRATFTALQAERQAAPDAPAGLCVLLAGPEERRRRPQAEWEDPRALYAGYLQDARQVRIAYFEDALIAPAAPAPPPLPDSSLAAPYRIEPFAQQSRLTAQDVIELWMAEGALERQEAERRAAEILVVATDADHRPVGVCTTYLQRNDQLRAELWYTRVFVAAAHRRSGVAIAIAHAARDHLVGRHRTGEDRRGIGVLFEVQSEILKRFFPQAIWPRTDFAFIGEDAGANHIRVHYFPGALAPDPDD